jgi:protein-S-isoprenylcysteine O-methyltransferase Ste14
MTQDPDAREALASIQAAREGLNDRLAPSLAYDLTCAGFWAVVVAGQGLQTPWSYYSLAIAFAGLALCLRWWKSRHGFSAINATPGTRRVGTVMVVLLLLLMAVSMWSKGAAMTWIPLATGAVAFVVAMVCGRVWMRAYRKELRASLQ